MKANPGYKWCPTTSKPVKSPPCQSVSNARKKVWSFPSCSSTAKDSTTAKRMPKADSMPQLNFAMAGERGRRRGPSAFVTVVIVVCFFFLFQILQRWEALACCC